MIGELKPYSAYKDSGLPWLGEVPEHWEVVPLSSIARPRKVTNEEHRDLLSVYLGRGVIPFTSVEEKRTNTTSEDLSKYQLVEPGDFVLNNQQAWRGSVGVSRYTGIVSPAYLVLALDKRLDREFADKLFSDRAMVAQYLVCSKGVGSIQRNLYWLHLKRAATVIPPLPEQTQIATFLDYADRRIRRYIRSKQKLIKLLEEQKQIIINQAVTRGLDPTVPLKPSGIEWLGDIPDHWEVSRLKFEASQIVDCLHATPEYVDDGIYPAIRTADIEPGKLRLKTVRRVNEEQYLLWTSRMTPRAGDILYSREGERFGIAAIVPEGVELCISQRMMAFRIRSSQDSEFIMWQLNCRHVYAQASGDIIGATSPHVNVERIKNYEIVLPPLNEQKCIASEIEKRCSDLEKAIACTHDDISLLREFRTRLIADVVTGKLDVREASAHLPAELDEPEPLEDDLPNPELDSDADSYLEATAEDEAA
ncbi:restriction endonuclease subunit S [Leptolyngbya sp. CCNP1308]|uniref:restriction endonuclease subunit S n=1 Tax=Leptolyngbya sp. CCNP1308 TaxID=3110255 RepID=UPI002B20F31F|nr:restriction endonuclease subunit S [Leptolyngbya sp. CCNP1308]MEA5449451.1 restriction endonuclease subunit S [Leptolyngbya sp. CCNP1308]